MVGKSIQSVNQESEGDCIGYGTQLAIVISLLSFSSLGEIYGYRKIFLSGEEGRLFRQLPEFVYVES